MNDEDFNDLLARLIEDPRNRSIVLRDAELEEAEASDLIGLLEASDALWLSDQGAPPLEDDPVAAMLGLIKNPLVALDSKALARHRKRARMTISELAARLKERGWEVQTGDIFRWENRSAPEVAPALIQAIASVLQTSSDHISVVQEGQDQFSVVRKTAQFQELLNRWMKALDLPRSTALAALESRMVTTVHRGEEPDPVQLLAALDILVSSVEESQGNASL